ncbi:MAG TPA: amino acid adenylation domain-containing protein [Pyrinomonadaceae bacterium]
MSRPNLSSEYATLVDLLRRRASEEPLRRAYRFLHDAETGEQENYTYADLDQQARAIAAHIQTHNVFGERVLLVYPAGLDYVSAFFGCLYAGAVAVPTYPPRLNRTLDTLRSIADDSQAKVVLTTRALLAKMERMFGHAPELRKLHWIATDDEPGASEDDWREPQISCDTLAFLQYTSGSTGTPKGVMISHGNLLHNSSFIAQGFGYTRETECLTWLPLYHDMGLIGGVLQPLYGGFSTTLMSPLTFARSPYGWLKAISDYGVTLSGAPDFAYDLCVRRITAEQRATLSLESWTVAFTGAEPIRVSTLESFTSTFAECGFRPEAFMPCYGLAEATLMVSCGDQATTTRVKKIERRALEENIVREADDNDDASLAPGCGQPFAGQTLRIVNPETHELCEADEVGEIWVSSPSVAHGYWRKPEETEKIFHARIKDSTDGPFLRTRDLGFLAGGELYVTGRVDDLIIIRGRNYYPQDIETAVAQTHDALRANGGAVFAHQSENENRLVVVHELDQRRKADATEVSEQIRRTITEQFELPLHAVVLVAAGGVPKTSSGKVRRKACRSLFLNDGLEVISAWYARVDSPTAEVGLEAVPSLADPGAIKAWLAAKVAAQLRVTAAEIDVDQPIANYGLDSLSALELAHSIGTAFGVNLSLVNLLEGASISELAAQVQTSTVVDPPVVVTVRDTDTFPLSHGQQSLWFLHRLDSANAAYNISIAARIRTPLDIVALKRSFQSLINRHTSLRTIFTTVEGETIQRVLPHVDVSFQQIQLSDSASSDQLATAALAPFDLEHGPLMRVTVFERSSDHHVLLLSVHHIISDFWSLGLLLFELGKFYDAEIHGTEPQLPTLTSTYTDYAFAQREMLRGPEGEQHWDYWREQLSGELPILNFPTDRPRSPQRSYNGTAHFLRLTNEQTANLKALAQQHDLTLYMTLLAAFQLLLQRYSGQDDIIVGSPTSGRSHARFASVPGYFVNTLPLRADLSGDPPLTEFLQRVRRRAIDAFKHQDFPFSLMVERLDPLREPGRSPIFDVAFIYQKFRLPGGEDISAFALGEAGASVEIGGLELESVAFDKRIVQFDLALVVAESDTGTALSFQYDTDLFDASTIARFAGNFEFLLDSLTTANPKRPISALPILTAAEQQQLHAWNDATTKELPLNKTLHEWIEEQVERTPAAVALRFEDVELSYRELNERANQLANYLRGLGVGPEVVVGICMERSVEMVVGLLGILKAGGAYLPLDPSYPAERLNYMLSDAGVSLLLTQGKSADGLSGEWNTLRVDDEWSVISQAPRTKVESGVTADNLAYVIYTSGSTGRPKGSMLQHRGICNRLQWMQETYGLSAADAVLQKTSFSFDVSVWEFFWPLMTGARLVLAQPEGHRDAAYLTEVIKDERITVIHFVPSMLQAWLTSRAASTNDDEECESLRLVVCSGEALNAELQRRFVERLPWVELENLYGPTEASVDVTRWRCGKEAAAVVPIGHPVWNTQMYVLGRELELLPVGVVGELYIGGVQLARGYAGRPELTAERFIPHPHSNEGGARLYRTGDLGRYLADGAIEYVGRTDDQVKIRGFRIELGEIEAVLLAEADISKCVVVAREDEAGEKRLVAYVVAKELDEPSVRERLRVKLPDYMTPSAFVVLSALPLNANGKIDRRALPQPDTSRLSSSQQYVAPQSEVEMGLAQLWAEVLRLDRVSIHSTFFDLGGHSLLAIKLVSRIREVFNIDLPLRLLFERPTVALLAHNLENELRRGRITAATPIVPLHKHEAPLSFAQQRLWFIDQFEEGSSAFYNMPAGVRLKGRLDLDALARTFNEIVRRHHILRTAFVPVDGQPVQVVQPDISLSLPLADLSHLQTEERDVALQRLRREEAELAFDLSTSPLLRVSIVRLSPDDNVVLLIMHHIVSDGWSIGVIVREVVALYEAYAAGEQSPLPELPIQYTDFAAWQREQLQGEALARELDYWRGALGTDLPTLNLPTDRPRPAVQSYRGGQISLALTTELTSSLRELAQQQGATLFMVLLASFQGLLQRYSGQDEIVVGTPVAGREQAETESLIGFFVNTIVLRSDLSGNPSFTELLVRVRNTTLNAYAHQAVPFEKLVEELQPQRSLSHAPLFQVAVSYLIDPLPELRLPELEIEFLETNNQTAKFDLSLELQENSDSVAATINYSTDLFDVETIRRMAGHFQALLTEVVLNPEERLSKLSLLNESERTQLLVEWNATATAYPKHACVHQLFEKQVEQTPQAVALSFAGEQLTYQELNERANRLAHRLVKLGVKSEVLVGLCMERSFEMIVGVLAILKAGGAYLPLDPEYPRHRLELMLKDAGAKIVLTQQHLDHVFTGVDVQTICLDSDWSSITEESEEDLPSRTTPENLAYVMYTSGSTGEPKGVSVRHRSVIRLVKETNYVDPGPDERFLLLAPLTFDASTFEIWGCLLNGAQLVIMPPGPASLEELGATITNEQISTLWLTAGLFHQMVDTQLDSLQGVRQLLAGGDVLSPVHVQHLRGTNSKQRLINGYGPTENTTFTCCYATDSDGLKGSVPIGRPISNTTVFVLDQEYEPVPIGVVGELYIGGDGLARDYFNQPALTAEKFVPNPFATSPGERMYCTGDRVRYLRNGVIEFVGRGDEQIKLRGFRIEPGEIKYALEQHPQVREAEVIVRGATAGDKRLVAYIVSDEALNNEDLRDFLAARLPRYMVPTAFVSLGEMPLTGNGKIDRRALPEPDLIETSDYQAPQTPTQEIIAGIWCRILNLTRVGLHDDFFHLGGHSLLATQVVSRLREAFKVEISLRSLFANPTVSALADSIDAARRDEAELKLLPIEPLGSSGELPLSFAQQRLWFLDQLEPGNIAFNMSTRLRFRGSLNITALANAFSEITTRHEILRATFVAKEGRVSQVIAPPHEFNLSVIDLRAARTTDCLREEQRLSLAEASEPFSLQDGPLLRAQLLQLKDDEHILLFSMHHIISDGWSMRVLLRELKACYEAFVTDRTPQLSDLAVQYTDYAAWQLQMLESDELQRQLSYWREQLRDAPSLLQLPTDKPRPSVQTFNGENQALLLDAELRNALLSLSRSESSTLFMTLLATFEVLLQRLSGQEDFLIGAPIAGRNRSEVEGLIGIFLNSLTLRADLAGNPSFRELLRKVRETTLNAHTHQDVPFEKILEEVQPERTLSHTPLFQVFFNMINLGTEELNLPGLDTEFEFAPDSTSKFDLTLYLEEQVEGIFLRLVYNSDLFGRERMVELLEQYKHLLKQIVVDPDANISTLSLVTTTAREVLPDPTQPLDNAWIGSVPALFSEHARQNPHRIAVNDKHAEWTYEELDVRSNQLAHFLLARGIQKGDAIAIYAHRSASLVWALLGTMKAGAAFVLLDAAYPPARLIECLRIAGPRGWLQLEEAGPLAEELAQFIGSSSSFCARLELPIRPVASERGLLNEYPATDPQIEVGPDDLAYLSFTSGTTGLPKAILGRHGPLTHFLPWLKDEFGLDEATVFTMLSGLSHDPLHRDIFTPLQLGGRVAIPDPQMIGTSGWLAEWMRGEEANVANLTPAMGRFILESSGQEAEVSSLRYLFFVGDVLTKRDVALFQKLAPAATVINFYGSTETQRAVSYYVVSLDSIGQEASNKEIIPLGRGIRDVQLLLLNATGGLAGIGEVGEIYFRSPHLARGYKGDATLTAERFLVNSFTCMDHDRLYRTGDLGRYLPNGDVEPLGRRDAQVKVRGYRVELGEIESVLAQHPTIAEAAVMAREDGTGEKWLVAYVVTQPGIDKVSTSEMRRYLRQRLPDYMVPGAFVVLTKLPLTPNGKLDRRALPEPEQSVSTNGKDYAAPRTDVEKRLGSMWAELLRVPRVGIHDNFFELGGHSLLGIQLVSRMRREFRIELPLRTLFETPTVAALGSLIEDQQLAENIHEAPIQRRATRSIEELLAELE